MESITAGAVKVRERVGPVLALVLVLAGCRSTRTSALPPPEPEPLAPEAQFGLAWMAMPLSWEKLDAIEAWLASGAGRSDPPLEVRAELELAEGRLHYANMEDGRTTAAVLALRRLKAEQGFQRVIADSAATAADRERARAGLVSLGRAPAAAPGAAPPLAAGPRIQTRALWHAAPPVPSRLTRNRGAWNRITIHHSGPPDRNLHADPAESEEIIRRIQKHHMENNRWGDIGYHFLVTPEGGIYEGRSLAWQGAHAGHDAAQHNNNPHNIGVCVLGDYQTGSPTPAALAALEALIDRLRLDNGIPRSRVVRHNSLTASVCPGPALGAWVERYRSGADPVAAGATRRQGVPRSASAVRSNEGVR